MNSIEYIINGLTLAFVIVVVAGLIGFIVGLIKILLS